MFLMKAFNWLLPVFMPNSSCSFSSFCEWGLGLSPGGVRCRHFTGDWRILWGQYAQDAAMLSCNSPCCDRVLVLLLKEIETIEIVLIKMNTNKSLDSWQLIPTESAKAIVEIDLPESECVAPLLKRHKKSAPSHWGWCHCVQELLLPWAEMQIVTHVLCNCITEIKCWSYLSISPNRKFYGLGCFVLFYFFLSSFWCLNLKNSKLRTWMCLGKHWCYITHLWKFHLESDLEHRSTSTNRCLLIGTPWSSFVDSYVSATLLFFLKKILFLL